MSAIAVATIGGALISANASSNASNQAAQGNANAQAIQQNMFSTVQNQTQPYSTAGANAMSSLGTFMNGSGGQSFTNADLNANLAPNYQFQLGQGMGATANAMNAQGGLGGNEAKALSDYSQNYAAGAYQNAFNNFNTSQGNIYNRLSGIAGIGAQANQTLAGAATGAANGMSSASIGQGNAAAAGTMGAGNALSGGAQTLGAYNYLNGISQGNQNASTTPYTSNMWGGGANPGIYGDTSYASLFK